MLFKLSLKNIKKSVKDYSIYFFTLVFAVSMFYMFNSIDAQSSMLVLNESKYEIIQSLTVLIQYVSVFVSIVLGFLIVYSNNFLIRRRKKEIGMYEILGMSKRKVSLILFLETVFVGIVSLVVGLLVGIFLSQFLSIFVSKLFEADLSQFKFVFSILAFKKTILYFGIIFFFVIIFNVITLNRYKLIDLITADRKNESVKIRNKYVTIISFILCVITLGYAYYLLIHDNALLMMDNRMLIMIICGSIGTFLLFFSLSGFLLKVIEHIKKVYYKDLNIFTLKQVNNKINTTVISTSVICLMLLLTIGLLSGSFSLATVFNNDLTSNNLTDYTVRVESTEGYKGETKENKTFMKIEDVIKNNDFKNYTDNYVLLHQYVHKDFDVKDLLTEEDIINLQKEYGTGLSLDFNVNILKESEFNKYLKMLGKEEIDIKENQYLLSANIDFVIDAFKNHYKTNIAINGTEYYPATTDIYNIATENSSSANNGGIVILDDANFKDLDLVNMTLLGNFVKNDNEELAGDNFYKYLQHQGISFGYQTRISMQAASLGLKTIAIFLGLYLGITFAISSATVLAIGQLSESSDNKKRYRILSQIGADTKMINKALFTQIAITFAFPLVIALIHSYFGLKELNELLIALGTIDLTSNILFTTLFMIIIYGGYFIITYLCSKNIIKNSNIRTN